MIKRFKTLKFTETMYSQIQSLPTEEMQLRFFKAICNYGMNKIDPNFDGVELAIWIPMRDMIDYQNTRSRINSENGKKGGAPIGNQNRVKPL